MMIYGLRSVLTATALLLVVTASACSGGGGGGSSTILPPANGNAAPAADINGQPVTIREFPAGDTLPQPIAIAHDGNPWYLTLHHVNRMTTNGTVTTFVGPQGPGGQLGPELGVYSPNNDITIGPDNAVWFTADGNGADVNPLGCMEVALARISPAASAGTTADVVACPGAREHGEKFQSGIVAGPGGDIWMVDQNGGGLGTDGSQYQQIALNGSILLQHNLPAPCTVFGGFDPYIATGITLGHDGALYVVAGSPCGAFPGLIESSAVIRISAGGAVTNVFPLPDAVRIAAGSDGNVWVTQNGSTNAIGRITPTGSITEFPIPTPNAQPLGIASGNDGAIWFTETASSKIGRITTAGVMTEYATPTANATPYGIASLAGACGPGHGLVWFTESSANKIGMIQF